MPLITLLSDIGTKDHYVATVKGYLYSQLPDAQIVDVTHDIPAHSINEAAFVLRQTFTHFPPGTIHLISVLASFDFLSNYIAVKVNDQYFIGTDNGIFSMAFEGYTIQGIVDLSNVVNPTQFDATLQLRDVFAKAAVALCTGTPMRELGLAKNDLNMRLGFAAGLTGNVITGNVIYNDHFGNAITNISKEMFLSYAQGKKFVIEMRKRNYNISKIHTAYNSVAPGDIIGLFNSSGLLEIAINQGSVKELLNLNSGDVIKIMLSDD